MELNKKYKINEIAKDGKEKLNTPVLLANTEWIPPERLLNEVKAERRVISFCDLVKPDLEEKEVGDAECLAYMMPETGKKSLPPHYTEIYLYLATQIMKRWKIEPPKEIKVETLSDYENQKLKELKRWIYKSRGGKFKNPVLTAINEVFCKK